MSVSASAPRVGNEFWQFNPEARRGAGEYRYNWHKILPAAVQIVRSYRTTGVTLRQLFYRLVAAEMLPNTQQSYGSLSANTAAARRGESPYMAGRFPALIDNNREVTRPHLWEDAAAAAEWLHERYMEPRAAPQEFNIYVGVEKKGLVAQLFQWFAPLGLPVVALGGYPSQTLCDEVREEIDEDGRPAVLIYAGDFDADGEDIPRDFEARVGAFEEVRRVALNPDQVETMQLPPQPRKWTSARSKGFAAKYADLFEDVYGFDLVQIELDAISPTDLRAIYRDGVDEFYDHALLEDALEHEREEKAKIAALAGIEEEDDDDGVL